MPLLSTTQKNVLRRSSRTAIETIFQRLDPVLTQNRWLYRGNRYRRNCVNRIQRDTAAGRAISSRHLADYIAVSAPLHCSDGWCVLGRALECHSRGDSDAARHLGYYAELRAAVGLLAAEGIGIFSSQHFIVDARVTCQPIPRLQSGRPPGTHVITWLALEHWADLHRSGDLVLDIIQPAGVALREWVVAFGGVGTASMLASRWLKAWGLDLKRLGDDRDARNEASYRPTRLNYGGTLTALDRVRFLRELWSLYEPRPLSRFEILDRHLLREGFEDLYQAKTGRRAEDDRVGFRSQVEMAVGAVLPPGPDVSRLRRFLLRDLETATPAPLVAAGRASGTQDPRHHTEVMSRAALLLRVASGASARLLRLANINRDACEFWWKPLGEERGLWGADNAPDDFTELWADIEAAVDDTRTWEEENAGGQPSSAKLLAEQSRQMSYFSEGERPALWGLGL